MGLLGVPLSLSGWQYLAMRKRPLKITGEQCAGRSDFSSPGLAHRTRLTGASVGKGLRGPATCGGGFGFQLQYMSPTHGLNKQNG